MSNNIIKPDPAALILDMETHPQRHRAEPCHIIGNIYFAGDDNVGVHIFDTGEWLLLIDTAFPQTQAFLINSIWELGFKPKDIKAILHTHAHIDHIGTTNILVALSGAKTYLSETDAKMMREHPEMTYCDVMYHFEPDVLLNEGDIVTLGNTAIRVVATPGHTAGTLSFFGNVRDNDGKEYTFGMHGGAGINTLTKEYIEKYNLPEARESYVQTLRKLMNKKVDITLGNHTAQNRTLEKRAEILKNPEGPNPFIDPSEWRLFLERLLKRYDKMLSDEG